MIYVEITNALSEVGVKVQSINTSETANGEVGTIKVYKPAARSNMKEKMQGLVLSQNQMLVTEIKSSSIDSSITTWLILFSFSIR